MTLRAVCVAGRSQPDWSSMVHMAGSAIRGKNLISVMNRSVVAFQARLVSGMVTKDLRPADLEGVARCGPAPAGRRPLAHADGPIDPLAHQPSKPTACPAP